MGTQNYDVLFGPVEPNTQIPYVYITQKTLINEPRLLLIFNSYVHFLPLENQMVDPIL